jgi:dihydrofolate synthase/folylpolyglutamate synthase
VQLALRGEHQVPNALIAVRLLEALEQSVPITADAIRAGLRDVRWPGRLQMLEVPGGRRVLVDAAHNPAGAYALSSYLRTEFPEALPIVFGALRDKDAALMLKALLPVASMTVMTEPESTRARSAEELAAIARRLSPKTRVDVEPNPEKAMTRAWTECPVICVAGSIFLVGDVLAALGPRVREL